MEDAPHYTRFHMLILNSVAEVRSPRARTPSTHTSAASSSITRTARVLGPRFECLHDLAMLHFQASMANTKWLSE
jgi:hypothetical protein